MPFLEVNSITKRYRGEAQACVKDMSFSLERGRILVLLGASGCGKTTILKLIAGLEQPDCGSVRIDGQAMDGVAPEKRPISMVFQKALLFNNMTVEQNINFAPRVNRSMGKEELASRTNEMLELLGLQGFGKKRANALSGGQEQRVSLARALMVSPKLLLLDEPLSALDAGLRESMQGQIRRINEQTGVTMLLVTHDQQEAIALADEIAVMAQGRILQMASPQEFYSRPKSRYVAEFFGWKNFLDGSCKGDIVECALGRFSIPGAAQGKGTLVMRPEAACNVGSGALRGTVLSATYKGMSIAYTIECRENILELVLPARDDFGVCEEISFDLDEAHLWFTE